jgi:hypothetical protein
MYNNQLGLQQGLQQVVAGAAPGTLNDRVAAMAKTLERLETEYKEAHTRLEEAVSIRSEALGRLNACQNEFNETVMQLQQQASLDSNWGGQNSVDAQRADLNVDEDFLNAR